MPPRGKITRIAVTYTVNTSDGPRHTFHGLIGMQRYVRPDRLRELEDDLSVICEDLLANRPQPATGLPQDVVRIPFSPDLPRPWRTAPYRVRWRCAGICWRRSRTRWIARPRPVKPTRGCSCGCVRTGRGWPLPRYARCWRQGMRPGPDG